jgi:phospholipase/carboxylesterase
MLAVVGFSQGGMLALDLALAGDPAVDRVAVLSGALLADSLHGLGRQAEHKPAVFVAHGRFDQIVPFRAAELMHTVLPAHGHELTFQPFPGGHEIPPQVVSALDTFLWG